MYFFGSASDTAVPPAADARLLAVKTPSETFPPATANPVASELFAAGSCAVPKPGLDASRFSVAPEPTKSCALVMDKASRSPPKTAVPGSSGSSTPTIAVLTRPSVALPTTTSATENPTVPPTEISGAEASKATPADASAAWVQSNPDLVPPGPFFICKPRFVATTFTEGIPNNCARPKAASRPTWRSTTPSRLTRKTPRSIEPPEIPKPTAVVLAASGNSTVPKRPLVGSVTRLAPLPTWIDAWRIPMDSKLPPTASPCVAPGTITPVTARRDNVNVALA